MMESCAVCGGDGQMLNAFGSSARCPACHGSGRRSDDGGMRDVTKTKPSHYRTTPGAGSNGKAAQPAGPSGPTTPEGALLAHEVNACATISNDTKSKLTREIVEYEGTHGKCTQTFTKKIRRQLRGAS